MKLNCYQINAFTSKVFGGNPACVVPLKSWLEDELLLKIAKENAVAETAYYIDKGDKIHLRWFTPDIEMDLCGHATLATAFVLKEILKDSRESLLFETASGILKVTCNNNFFSLDFPSRKPSEVDLLPIISQALNLQPKEVLKARDYVLVYDTQQEIQQIKIDRQIFDQINLDPGGVVVTAKGDDCDFVSRFFTPQASILEDPVTGSAHCTLIPFWSERLNKKEMKAKQISERGGQLNCQYLGNRVLIGGTGSSLWDWRNLDRVGVGRT